MTEESLVLADIPFQMIRTTAYILVILASAVLIVATMRAAEINTLEKAARDADRYVLTGKATETLGVFSEEKLDALKASGEPIIEYCGYGLEVEIKGAGKEWKFGHEITKRAVASDARLVKAAIRTQGRIEPATLKIKLYDAFLPKLACAINTAYADGMPQDITYDVNTESYVTVVGEPTASLVLADLYVKKSGSELCALDYKTGQPVTECEKLDAPLHDFHIRFNAVEAARTGLLMKAVPVKNVPEKSAKCSDLQPGEKGDAIVLCIDDPAVTSSVYFYEVPA